MRNYLVALVAGAFAGCIFVAVLLVLDVGGLRTLIFTDDEMAMPSILLLCQMAGLFGIGVAALAIAESEPGPDGGHRHPIARWRRSLRWEPQAYAAKDQSSAMLREVVIPLGASSKSRRPHI